MALHLVRHAAALPRTAHVGSDLDRELDARGLRQAAELALHTRFDGVTRIVSSPAVRCTATVEPLAARLGLEVEPDPRLYEGHDPSIVFDLGSTGGGDIVVCSHGDIIPEALRLATLRGADLVGARMVEKGSTWTITFEEGRPLRAERTAAPA